MFRVLTLDLADAQKIVQAVVATAQKDGGLPVSVAVVGAHGRLLAFASMNGANPISVQLAMNKAYSAVMTGRDTQKNANRPVPLDPFNYGDARITTFPGGVVLTCDDQIVGGLGVSGRKGSRPDSEGPREDHELAEEGRQRLN